MNLADLQFAPDFRLEIGGAPIPSELRSAVISISVQTGLEGADRVDLTFANDALRWLDDPLFALDTDVVVGLGYAPAQPQQVFVGQVVAVAPVFPSGGYPTLKVTAQDARFRMQQAKKLRWFAIPVPTVGNFPIPDLLTAPLVTLENLLVPVIDPVGAAISVILGGAEVIGSISEPGGAQKFIRKQASESDYDFLARVARENGWDMFIEHDGPAGGHLLRFQSPLDHLETDVALAWGRSLLEFAPRITTVGQIFSVSAFVWISEIKMTFTVTLGWDWDRMSLTLLIYPAGFVLQPGPTDFVIKDPVTPLTAPRRIVGELLPKLNTRLTGTGATIGNPAIRAGTVLRLDGLGVQFGGLYRVTSATHRLDGSGYRTEFEVRKEVWFGSIPAPAQGATPLRASF